MTINLNFQPSLQKFIESHQVKIKDAVYKSLLKSGYLVQGSARYFAPVDTGLLRSTITVVGDYSQPLVMIGTNLGYAAPQEFGTKPHWAPLRPIAEWAIRKNIPREVIGKIWYSIAWHGTQAHPYMQPALTENLQKIQDNLLNEVLNVFK